ncbi:hypothetical protein Q4603_18850 [Zobellia galactanivorans]|uniref:hypothetical protein n=1 Tax=Zobellia galactanivorans (strain DSM 12802 / CCUG 47099 / CIP 106680 / NCIMB 13871 / Dsij) TaxID=63186 RepID=UPI0026E23E21|nr:hypothetical protein [Zobellia galactanivorans]MDO6810690.1 hypothetical protein [Zobellia galactanivorans]
MKNIKKLLGRVIDELKDDSVIKESIKEPKAIPTLQKNCYKKLSPQLFVIYKEISYWEDSTHGDWIDFKTMELFWENTDNALVNNVKASIDNWENDIAKLFKESRISIFAGSEYTNERVYLVWFDSTEEPEVWVYDTNGESRFKDISCYLKAYLDDDLSTLNEQWHPSLKS